MNWRFFLFLCNVALLTGCAAYRPEPIDLAKDMEAWRKSTMELCPPGTQLDVEEMHRIGLLFNPGLNQARLTLLNSMNEAEYAALWEDPSLSLDVERVLKKNLINPGASAGFSLPVTGLPKLSRRIAEQYAESDYWNLREKERLYLAGVDALRYRIFVTHAKRQLAQERLVYLRDEYQRIVKLYEMGETDLPDYQSASQRLNDTIKALQELDKEHLEQHQELVAQLGLHPSVGEVELEGGIPNGVPPLLAAPEPGQLAGNPGIKAALAAYGATEDELRAEIRRQYPEITLSPGYNEEDEEKKLALGFEFSLPIWNRNRAAIVKASGSRSLKRHETVQAWRQLLQESLNLQQQQELSWQHCMSEHRRLAGLQAAADQQERLYAIGESSLPALAEARHEIYQRSLSYLDCLAVLLDVQVKLQYLQF